jgi:hypothetical protein
LDIGWTLHGQTQVTFMDSGIDRGKLNYTQVLMLDDENPY